MASYLETHDFSESDLLGHAVAGDKGAFTTLVSRHQQKLLAAIGRELAHGDNDYASDLAQQALLEVYRTLPAIDRTRPFFDSVMESARTLAAATPEPVEETFTSIRSGGNPADKKALEDSPSGQGLPESSLATQESAAALQALLVMAQVKQDQHAPGVSYLFAICVRGHTIEQIARREQTTPDKIETAVRGACQSMRASLQTILAP